jgi:hypothetical protein
VGVAYVLVDMVASTTTLAFVVVVVFFVLRETLLA